MSALVEPIPTQPFTAGADRYPGVLPFGDTALDRLRFFGRDDQAHLLVHELLSSELLVLFAKSGLGKTSLLNTRLFPLLRRRDFLPLGVRFNRPGESSEPMDVFTSAIGHTCEAEGIDYTPGNAAESLWEFLKTAIFWRGDRLQTPVLILDQFEEIFTLQKDAFRHRVAAELGQLISRRLPDHLRQQLHAGKPLPFSETPPEVRILISLREDDLGMLQEVTPEIPSILDNRFRLTGLSLEDAQEAILGPASLEKEGVSFATYPFKYDKEAVRDIIAAARNENNQIDPFFLQLICSQVEAKVLERQNTGEKDTTVDPSYLGGRAGITSLVAKFCTDAIRRVPIPDRARHLCEKGLLTETGGRRSLLLQDIKRDFQVDVDSLDILVATRLLRKESKHQSFYYEISHDSLAKAIWENRLPPNVKDLAQELTKEKQLRAIATAVALAGKARREQELWKQDELAASLAIEAFRLNVDSGDCVRDVVDASLRGILSVKHFSTILTGHQSGVEQVTFSPDGSLLATSSYDSSIRLWQLRDRGIRSTVFPKAHEGPVWTLAFNSDGQTLASGGADKRVLLWDIRRLDAGPFARLSNSNGGVSHHDEVKKVIFSQDGRYLLSAGLDKKVRIWLWKDRACVKELDHDAPVWSIDADSRLTVVASGSAPKANTHAGVTSAVVGVWDLRESPPKFRELHRNKEQGPLPVAICPLGNLLAAGRQDGSLLLWDLASDTPANIHPAHSGPITSLAFNHDGARLATCSSDFTVLLWNMVSGETPPARLRGHRYWVTSVAFDPSGAMLASGSADKCARLWDLREPSGATTIKRVADEKPAWINSIAFTDKDGCSLVSGGHDGVVRLWNRNKSGSDHKVLDRHKKSVWAMALSSDARVLAAAGSDNYIRLYWDFRSDKPQYETLMGGDFKEIRAIAFHPTMPLLVSGGGDMLRMCNLSSASSANTCWKEVADHSLKEIRSAAFSRTGNLLVAGGGVAGGGGRVVLWNFNRSDQEVITKKECNGKVRSVALHPTQPLLAVANDDKVCLWKLDATRRVEPDTVLGDHEGNINAVAFSPDGSLLATGCGDAAVRLWRVPQFIEQGQWASPVVLLRHEGWVSALSFSADSRYLASGGGDGAIIIFIASTDILASMAEEKVRSGFDWRAVVQLKGGPYE